TWMGVRMPAQIKTWSTYRHMTFHLKRYTSPAQSIKYIVAVAHRAGKHQQKQISVASGDQIAPLARLKAPPGSIIADILELSPPVGSIAGLLAALSPTLIVFSTPVLTAALFLFFFALMLLAGARFLPRPGAVLAVCAGVTGGLSLATRPAVAPLQAAAMPVF